MIESYHHVFPDVFLGGTPKSGTTFLFDLLAQHANINPSWPKEPFYYVDEDCPFNQQYGPNAKNSYQLFFSENIDAIHLDGTSQTIYQSNILEQLKGSSPLPKLIVVLREPARRMFSSFNFTKNNLGAVKSSYHFKSYAHHLLNHDLESIKVNCRNDKAFYSLSRELDFSNYVKYLKKWEEVIGAEHIKVLLFEEMMTDPLPLVNSVLMFIGLNPEEFDPLIEQKNETVNIKHRYLHYLSRKALEVVGHNLPFKERLKELYTSVQHSGKKDSASKVHEELALLRAYFEPMNEELSKSFNLNLSVWKS